MTVPEKARTMIRVLRERILSGEFSDGRRLPSIRQLMEEFAISNGSVKKGIDYLVKAGLVETVHGSGVFVRKRPTVNHGNSSYSNLRLAVFGSVNLSLAVSGIYASVLVGLQRAADRCGCSLLLNPLTETGTERKRILDLSQGADGVIFLKELDSFAYNVKLEVPAVGVCMHKPTVSNLSIIDLDPYQAAFQSAEYFKSKNLKHVTIVSSPNPAYVHRGNVFAEVWESQGGTIEKIYSSKYPMIDFKSDCGYLFTTCSAMQCSLEIYHDKHKELPGTDVSLLGLDGKNFLDPSFYQAPAIVLDWEKVGEAALMECVERISSPGRSPRRIYMSGYLKIS